MLLLIISLTSCKQENRTYDKPLKQSIDSLNIQKEDTAFVSLAYTTSFIESIKKDSTIKNKRHLIYAIKHLFDFKSLIPEFNKIDTSFLKKQIKVYQYNEHLLIAIHYGQWSRNGLIIQLFLYDKNLKELGKGQLLGNQYHNGEIDITDWNTDGFDNIKYTISKPTKSVPYIHYTEEIYSFNSSFNFLQLFNLSLETRDCVTDHKHGFVIKRNYEFATPLQIKVYETTYKIDCENFQWYDSIPLQQRLNTTQYFMQWDSSLHSFQIL